MWCLPPLRFQWLTWWFGVVVTMQSLRATIMWNFCNIDILYLNPSHVDKMGPFTWDGLFIKHAFIGFGKLFPEYKHIKHTYNKSSIIFILGINSRDTRKMDLYNIKVDANSYVSIYSVAAACRFVVTKSKATPNRCASVGIIYTAVWLLQSD